MNRRILFCAFFLCGLLMTGANFAVAQWGARGLGNGITLATKTEITPQNSSITPIMEEDIPSRDDKTVSEIITDKKNKIVFGYNLTVDFGSEKGKYTLAIKPLSADAEKAIEAKGYTVKKLPRYPGTVEIGEEETLGIELMVNPKTGERISQYIKIYYKPADFTDFFAEREPIRDFTINDVGLKLNHFEVFADDKSILKVGGRAFGSVLNLYMRDRGNFIFSLFPRKGYDFQKIGAIEGNKILFRYGGVNYKIVSSESIIGDGGHWNLWVLHDSNYKPTFGGDHEFGGADGLINPTK